MNVLEQIVTNQSIFEEICNDNANAYEGERPTQEEEAWRKSDHVFDFDLEGYWRSLEVIKCHKVQPQMRLKVKLKREK